MATKLCKNFQEKWYNILYKRGIFNISRRRKSFGLLQQLKNGVGCYRIWSDLQFDPPSSTNSWTNSWKLQLTQLLLSLCLCIHGLLVHLPATALSNRNYADIFSLSTAPSLTLQPCWQTVLQLYVFSAKDCCTAALAGFVHTAPVGTRGTLVLLLWQISSRGGSCAACITPQAASLSFAFQSLAIWAASLFFKNTSSLFFKNTFLVFQYWHLQLQCMVLSYTSYVALACTDCCRNTWENEVFF